MMKYKFTVLLLLLVIFAACNQSNENKEVLSDTATTNAVHLEEGTQLLARMQADKLIRGKDSVMLTFNVYNPADSVQQFCKWHTPFEPLMSKYLEIRDQKGREPDYKGPMAKRIMPPPADSYVKVAPKETLSTKIDLLLGYDLKTGNTYTVIYAAEGISGLVVRDTVSFSYKK
ncbi:protease [Pedobacter sp. GR22-6]|uniref:protease n=1 Tax=Pedobacter sp. GR22-6 TaxID=3127957 RepID=UPI00307DA5FB